MALKANATERATRFGKKTPAPQVGSHPPNTSSPTFGSGLSKKSPMAAYVTLKIGETKSGQPKKLHALRTTADYYGWTKHFPIWVAKRIDGPGKYVFALDPGRSGHPQNSSGYHVRICRSPVTSGLPAGFTNRFKVTSNTGLFDLAELAHFTDVDWEWMEGPTTGRVSRADWERRYARTTH